MLPKDISIIAHKGHFIANAIKNNPHALSNGYYNDKAGRRQITKRKCWEYLCMI